MFCGKNCLFKNLYLLNKLQFGERIKIGLPYSENELVPQNGVLWDMDPLRTPTKSVGILKCSFGDYH